MIPVLVQTKYRTVLLYCSTRHALFYGSGVAHGHESIFFVEEWMDTI